MTPCAEGIETTAAINTVHEVRCCRECVGFKCWKPWLRKCKKYNNELYAGSKFNDTCMKGTFTDAVNFCRNVPGENTRLCTPDELKKSCAKGTGCQFDKEMIWSCGYNGYQCTSDTECCGACNESGICEGELIPTDSPTSTPTQAPTPTTATISKTLVCGKGGGPNTTPCAEGIETTAAIDTEHEVRCCRECVGFKCWKPWLRKCKKYNNELYAGSKFNDTCMKGTFTDAVNFCRNVPGENTRLCTPDELKKSCAKGTGCQFDKEMIWSCGYNGYQCTSDTECCGTCNESGICEGEDTSSSASGEFDLFT